MRPKEDDMRRQSQRLVAYLTVYAVDRAYGGPEEGGWWYEQFRVMGGSTPYEAEQDFEEVPEDPDEDDDALRDWLDRHPDHGWVPRGRPRALDPDDRNAMIARLERMFGPPGHFRIIDEIEPGALASRRKPVYR